MNVWNSINIRGHHKPINILPVVDVVFAANVEVIILFIILGTLSSIADCALVMDKVFLGVIKNSSSLNFVLITATLSRLSFDQRMTQLLGILPFLRNAVGVGQQMSVSQSTQKNMGLIRLLLMFE